MQKIRFLVLAAVFAIPQLVHALDWELRPSVSTGIMQYQFEQKPQLVIDTVAVSGGGVKVEDSLLFAGVGVSAFLGNFFADISLQKSDEGEDKYTQQFTSFDGNLINLFSAEQQARRAFDRDEFSVSIGYAVTGNWAFFGGYKRADTEFEDEGTLQQRTQILGTLEYDVHIDADFEQSGYFFGSTYAWPVNSDGWLNGVLSIDLGIAFLDGDLEQNTTFMEIGEPDTASSASPGSLENLEGDSVGLNLGVAWNGPLTDRLAYSLSVDGYDYDYDGKGISQDFTDTLFRYSLAISYALGPN